MYSSIRSAITQAILAAALLGAVVVAYAQATVIFDLPNQPLADSLRAVASQTNSNILFDRSLVRGISVKALKAQLSVDEALERLLEGTGLTYRKSDDKTIVIVAASAMTDPRDPHSRPAQTSSEPPTPGHDTPVHLAQAGSAQSSEGPGNTRADLGAASQGYTNEPKLEEIVVTAQKRTERLIDTPQSVSVLSGDYLTKIGAVKFSDFANTVPGLNFTTAGAGYTGVSLRGVTAGFDFSPTVGIYVDDVPYGSSTGFNQSAQTALDVGLFDIDRIEVLRGPQGTLYGASTMGGLIKYVTKTPDTNASMADLQAGVADIHDGGVSYNGSIAVNEPLVADKAAVRASAFYSHDGGYIDNVARSESNANRAGIYGGRLDLLLKPVEALSIRVAGFLQDISRNGEATADYTFAGTPRYGNLGQYRSFAEPYHQQFRLLSGTVSYDAGPVTLTSVSSYQSVRTNFVADISQNYVPFCAYAARACSAVGYTVDLGTDKFTQEVRLASKSLAVLEWLIGGFYTHETSTNVQSFPSLDLAGQAAPNDLFNFSSPTTYKERAAFGDLTWHLTNKVDVTGGLRYARNDQTYVQYGSGVFGVNVSPRNSAQGVLTYLGDVRYHFNEHATGYLRYATGYRPGGPNFAALDATTGLPTGGATFQPDRLRSYEAGVKAESTDRRFGVDLAGYNVDWSNIQLSAIRGGFSAVTNAPGGATVQGAELTLTARPVSAFTATGAFAYQHAYLKEADVDLGASKGERLPNVPRFTAALNADYILPVTSLRPTIGSTLRLVGDRTASFDKSTSFPQYQLPQYTTVDLRSGLTIGSVDMQLYVHNVFDEHGQLSLMLPQFGARVAIMQPRTIGINATTHF